MLGTQAVLDEYSQDGYLQRCVVDFPFPLGHLQMIRAQFALRVGTHEHLHDNTLAAAIPDIQAEAVRD